MRCLLTERRMLVVKRSEESRTGGGSSLAGSVTKSARNIDFYRAHGNYRRVRGFVSSCASIEEMKGFATSGETPAASLGCARPCPEQPQAQKNQDASEAKCVSAGSQGAT